MGQIKSFTGKFFFLSNFYKAPVKFDGMVYDSNENAFQAAKTLDQAARREFLQVEPGVSKKMGRAVQLRPDWEEVKDEIMYQIVLRKFRDNRDLWLLLEATGDKELVEGNNWHDNTWGNCTCRNCEEITGQNRLGQILMRVRTELSGKQGILH